VQVERAAAARVGLDELAAGALQHGDGRGVDLRLHPAADAAGQQRHAAPPCRG
jgi:hypothetical protein